MQAEILFWLAEDGGIVTTKRDQELADWRKVPLRPGALFVVGDPKQSIYRFRRADIDIYNIVRRRFSDPAVGRVVPLTLNFRSVPQLCNWANEVFQTRFPAEPTAYAPRFAALDANEERHRIRRRFHSYPQLATAKRFRNRMPRRSQPIFDRKSMPGAVDFNDFLILTRKKRDRIAPYAHALESLNIPVEVSGAGAFGESPRSRR